ncbi:bifunctional glutamate N-acetyltransferase/amino-acid acetyltransferase ArgJ [Thiolapillus brandeum]|uniref:Arginine biosynthesis bifunctional protein ArgJ n=1 Tax=Thiolapillus brandeum TaxID=1076588 RepID=A0A7U6GH82_9GAMM|nr:bifunctional glutamate N-acetyltransferase/amino-acid acetyltransferase ArgJ [Thiolapillus brandeum]BAO43514.1 glutamate N-acetyltransferase / amino-acid N-acetyltransferase [Thiolapillus brandeum]
MSAVPVYRVPGVRLAACAAGIRYQNRHDLVLMELAEGGAAAAVFTQNAFCAAPVLVARQHLEKTAPRYLLINSGNANAGTGEAGLAASFETCRLLAAATSVAMNQVLPFSTGVIGEDLPTEPFAQSIPGLLAGLEEDQWEPAAQAIMTTDTVPKLASRRFEVAGKMVTVTGMCKGSGMIRPDMATMLAYVASDAVCGRDSLQQVLGDAVAPSFNAITVDGDTSTNDACVLLASGASGVAVDDAGTDAGRRFRAAVNEVCMDLARAIVADGEGATKLVEILVEGADSEDQARSVAYTVAHSPLVKTALFASDPNWGRILAAVGRAGVPNLDISNVGIWLDDLCIVSQGGRDAAYTETAGQAVVGKESFVIRIALGRGRASARILTCDLSFDYVKINAEYRT